MEWLGILFGLWLGYLMGKDQGIIEGRSEGDKALSEIAAELRKIKKDFIK